MLILLHFSVVCPYIAVNYTRNCFGYGRLRKRVSEINLDANLTYLTETSGNNEVAWTNSCSQGLLGNAERKLDL